MRVERVVLWDIDGTLVHTAGVGAEAFTTAIETLFGVRAADHGVSLAGKTDLQIGREILTVLELAGGDVRLARLIAETERLVAAGQDRIRTHGRVLPGVPELIAALAAEPVTVQTLLTGNTATNAASKLGAFGLHEQLNLDLGAYGSDNADRNALVDVALGRIEARHGSVDRRRVWVIGDTPLDAACAAAGGVRCLLVASGFAPREALDACGADHVVDNLTDTEAILALLA